MPRPKRYRDRIARHAAIKLAACVLLIVGFTGIMMQSTAWNRRAVRTSEPFYNTLPGVDLNGVAAARLAGLLKDLNTRRCTCGCLRTVAGCRHHHGTCSFSVAIAREAAAAAR